MTIAWKLIEPEAIKVGMRIRRERDGNNNHWFIGNVLDNDGSTIKYEIVELLANQDGFVPNLAVGERRGYSVSDKSGDAIRHYLLSEKGEPMADIVNFIKRLGLSADDKALLDAGLEDPTGVPTSTGIDVMQKLAWKEKRAEIAKVAAEMMAEEKEKKA